MTTIAQIQEGKDGKVLSYLKVDCDMMKMYTLKQPEMTKQWVAAHQSAKEVNDSWND